MQGIQGSVQTMKNDPKKERRSFLRFEQNTVFQKSIFCQKIQIEKALDEIVNLNFVSKIDLFLAVKNQFQNSIFGQEFDLQINVYKYNRE